MADKQGQLPKDIRWHFIGHLQSNKVKFIAPFVHLVQGVDSQKLLKEIDNQASKINRNVNILLQVHIAEEETKFGFDEAELKDLMSGIFLKETEYAHVTIKGLMGMASFSEDLSKVRNEFRKLKALFDQYQSPVFNTLSMGMSGDYKIAIEEGSNMVRIGSLLFGNR
jgi:hypothetical protein